MGLTDSWTIDRLVAQCVFPRLDIYDYYEKSEYNRYIKKLVEFGVGGFCVFGGNLESVSNALSELQSYAQIPLLFCADFEYGLAMRLEEGTGFPHAMALGKVDDLEATEETANCIAKEAKELGIYWNLAPVADINSNPDNPVINIRAFGNNKELVAQHSVAYSLGTQKAKVLACAKHFPGHGDTDSDTHNGRVAIYLTQEDLNNRELEPFRQCIANGVKSIMVAHIDLPNIDTDYPASLSKKIVSGILRNEFNYQGIIITDALDMKAISESFPDGKAAVLALEAGNDIALMPDDAIAAISSLIEKADKDSAFYEKIKLSVEKIYKEKRWVGLIPQFAKPDLNQKLFADHMKTALKTAYRAIEIKGDKNLLPINDELSFAGFSILQRDIDLRAGSRFFTMAAQALESDCDFGFLDMNVTEEQALELRNSLNNPDFLLFAFFVKGGGSVGKIRLPENVKKSLKIIAGNKPIIALIFGNPDLEYDIEADLYIKTYSDSLASIAAAIAELTGRDVEKYTQL